MLQREHVEIPHRHGMFFDTCSDTLLKNHFEFNARESLERKTRENKTKTYKSVS